MNVVSQDMGMNSITATRDSLPKGRPKYQMEWAGLHCPFTVWVTHLLKTADTKTKTCSSTNLNVPFRELNL